MKIQALIDFGIESKDKMLKQQAAYLLEPDRDETRDRDIYESLLIGFLESAFKNVTFRFYHKNEMRRAAEPLERKNISSMDTASLYYREKEIAAHLKSLGQQHDFIDSISLNDDLQYVSSPAFFSSIVERIIYNCDVVITEPNDMAKIEHHFRLIFHFTPERS